MRVKKCFQKIFETFRLRINLPRDAKNSMLSIFGPIFGTVETSHISPPEAILILKENESAFCIREKADPMELIFSNIQHTT